MRRPNWMPTAAALALLIALSGCGPRPAPTPFAEYENIRAVELSFGDMGHVLDIASAAIAGSEYERKKDEHRLVYQPGDRGVFVTQRFPNERAKTAFAFGDSIEAATVEASSLLVRLCLPHELATPRLRVDVINTTSAIRSSPLARKWRWDMAHEGLIFGVTRVVPVLPQEVLGYEVFKSSGEYKAAGMKRLVKGRVLGNIVREDFQEDREPEFIQFKPLSFQRNEQGGVTLLLGVNRYDMPVNAETLRAGAAAGAEFLARNTHLDSGKFEYRYYPQRDLGSVSYSSLRHAGTAYALWAAYGYTKSEDVREAAEASLRWVKDHLRGPKDSDKASGADFLAMTEEDGKEAKTGGAGIALMGFTEHARLTGDLANMDAMRGLARFIRFNIREDGSLQGKYEFDRERAKPYDYPYYASECAAGLLRLNAIDPNPEWVDMAVRLLTYQRDVRDKDKTAANVTQDQWFVIAVNELQKTRPDTDLAAHAFFIGESMVSRQTKSGSAADLVGGFGQKPSSTSTASRVEALNELIQMATRLGDAEKARRYKDAALLAANVLLRLQYNEDNVAFFPAPHKALGGFMGDYNDPTIQIDYVQHAICALMGLAG